VTERRSSERRFSFDLMYLLVRRDMGGAVGAYPAARHAERVERRNDVPS
jgi:hypothetical protein